MFLVIFNMFLFVALMNFLDGNTTIGITFLLLGLSFFLLSTTHLKSHSLSSFYKLFYISMEERYLV